MHIKREWLFQFVVFIIFYLDMVIEVEHEGVSISKHPVIDFVFVLYEVCLFLIVNYVLIPKFLYTKRYFLFVLSLIGLIILFGIGEEGIVEKILYPNSRGENDVTWQSVYWFFGEILVPLLAFVTIKLMFDNFYQRNQLEKITQDQLTNELQLLKSQVQPHVIFNSLNNLYHFALEKADEVPGIILNLSNVLRYVLYEATDEKVLLCKEIEFIRDYIALQEIQYGERGTISSDITEISDSSPLKIAPFLLIPFIENSFKHSFGSKIEEVRVEINIVVEDDRLLLFIENNFEEDKGRSDELTQGGIGLVNVRKRLNLLYPGAHDLSITEDDATYIVELSIKMA